MSEIDKAKLYSDAFNDGLKQGKVKTLEEVYNRIDAGVCEFCEHYGENCLRHCNAEGIEVDVILKWLKDKIAREV